MTENKYKITINACFLAYIVQAIVNNFVPLLFVTFQRELFLRRYMQMSEMNRVSNSHSVPSPPI